MIKVNAINSTLVDSDEMAGGISMLRVLICDDDLAILDKVKNQIESVLPSLPAKVIIHTFADAKQISHQLLASTDIAFLDIDFDNTDFNGLDVARNLRRARKDAIIIFVTNFIEYAPEGYEVQAFRYILKDELEKQIRSYFYQAVEQINVRREVLKIQVNGEIIDILLENILYLEVLQHNVTAYIQRDSSGINIKTYCFYSTLSELEKKLEPHGFLRIHKSYLVNMKHLKRFQCREAILYNGLALRVGEKNYAENKKKYLLWKGWQ